MQDSVALHGAIFLGRNECLLLVLSGRSYEDT